MLQQMSSDQESIDDGCDDVTGHGDIGPKESLA
jgi:hypothetical protein